MATRLQYLPVPLCGILFSILSASLLNNKSRLAIGRERYPVQKDLSPQWASGQGERPPALVFSFFVT